MNGKIKEMILWIASISVLACVAPACDTIHDFPKPEQAVDPTEIETNVNINCKVQLSGINVLTKTDIFSGDSAALYDRRFLIDIRSDEYVDTLVESHLFTKDAVDTSDFFIKTNLQTRKYKVIVWMDYVKKGTETDLFYNTSNGESINAIHLPSAENYVAGSDFKDAQTFVSSIDLTPFAGQWFADITIKAPLSRPVSKITVLTNDLSEYAKTLGYTGPLKELAEDLTVEFSYDGFFPTGFNAYTGRLNDSETGFGFKTDARYPYTFEGTDYTRIGSDYVFVNGESSHVNITVKISSRNGQFIREVGSVSVPIVRDRETVVIYKFLTGDYFPKIGINPDFDGEFNIYV